MKFRKDINGIRAIAVVAVVLFHFNAAWMPGGFAGVDVFFVISGFLMTGIIFRGIEQNSFSLGKFYMARASRIIPALAALCLCLLVFGWFYLIPLDYETLGKHATNSIAFFSNHTYFNEAGYFDSASHRKWLLHTWSLSVEWQFYLLYPLLLLLLHKFFTIAAMKRIVVAGTVIGFVYCVYASMQTPDAAYYLLPSRAWEMLVGGVAYLYPLTVPQKLKKYLEWLGLLFIIGAYCLITPSDAWPGYLAAFPVLGVFMIIQAKHEASVFTSNIVAQKLGAWSYSIYLWHWPLVVAIYYFDLADYYIYPGMLLSVLLGFLSYQLVERQNFKSSLRGIKAVLTFKPLYMMILVAIVGRVTYKTEGFIWHYPDRAITAIQEADNTNPFNCLNEGTFECPIGNQDNVQAIMVGDSHADAMTTALASVFDLQSEGIIAITRPGCPFILGLEHLKNREECEQRNLEIVDYVNTNYPDTPIFWGARVASFAFGEQVDPTVRLLDDDGTPQTFPNPKQRLADVKDHLTTTISQISDNSQVFLIGQTPEMSKDIPTELSKALLRGATSHDLALDERLYTPRAKPIIEMLTQVANEQGATVIDPAPYFCQQGKCMAEYNNRPIYYDDDHLSEYGNKFLLPMFQKALNRE